MVVNTVKQQCLTRSIGSQQQECDAITEVEVDLALTAFTASGPG
jgi:hypothetical protein